MAISIFEKEYFRSKSTYKKFSDTASAIRGLTNYYHGLYQLISKYFVDDKKSITRVLEIGCGFSGLAGLFISNGYIYTGLDVSNFIVGELKQKYPNTTFMRHDIQQPIASGHKFDLIVGMEVLEHVPNTSLALENLREVLNDGGALVVTVPNPLSKIPFTDWRKDPTHISVMGEGDWVSAFTTAGFRNVNSTTVFSVPYVWRFGKLFSRFYRINKIGASIILAGYK